MKAGKPPARCIMVQGTASHAGKSVVAAGLCRILALDGLRAAPFKSQNMSLNSWVTPQGGEMGRAQALQAQACGIEPHTDMNPILLKPASDEEAQVILDGRPVGRMHAREYHARKLEFLPRALEALHRLRASCDVVVMEGAGSPAEINLKDRDIVNMRMAAAAEAPVVLVGDIDRGGVFASLVGTLELLDAGERGMVAGFIINKFRGSPELLRGGLDFLEERTGIPVLGAIPYIRDLGLEEEDSVNLEGMREAAGRRAGTDGLEIAVVHLPHISNATDFDPLAREPDVRLFFTSEPARLGVPDALIIPGSEAVCDDLAYLRRSGMAAGILRLSHWGVPVLGICGGYQMLGESVSGPLGAEGREGMVEGLGLLPVATATGGDGSAHRVRAVVKRPIPILGLEEGSPAMEGYEFHAGRSAVRGGEALLIVERDGGEAAVADGAVRSEPHVFGCHLHGMFENRAAREGFLNALRRGRGLPSLASEGDGTEWRMERLDRLAGIIRSSLDMMLVYSLLGLEGPLSE